MFGMSKDGIKVIDNVFAEFQNTVTKLRQGIELCDNQRQQNDSQIDQLNRVNSDLSSAKVKAQQFVENLTKLIPS